MLRASRSAAVHACDAHRCEGHFRRVECGLHVAAWGLAWFARRAKPPPGRQPRSRCWRGGGGERSYPHPDVGVVNKHVPTPGG
eukprot:731436-Prymnesium_polylepis.1